MLRIFLKQTEMMSNHVPRLAGYFCIPPDKAGGLGEGGGKGVFLPFLRRPDLLGDLEKSNIVFYDMEKYIK